MLDYLRGQIISIGSSEIILEAGNIGYRIIATVSTINKLGKLHSTLPSEAKILTYLHIQENKWELFGFADEKERRAFLLLLGCRGIGPKAALNILGTLPPARLRKIALGEEPVGILQQVPGIGAKSADRILVELKEKLPNMNGWEETENKGKKNMLEYTHEDLFNALRNLGYRTGEIQMAISRSSTLPGTFSEAVKQLLRMLGKG